MPVFPSSSRRASRLALGTVFLAPWLALALPAAAQSGPPLPKMPLPPSASDPAPVDKAKPGTRKPKRETKAPAVTGDTPAAKPAPRPRRSSEASTPSGSKTYERPTRYVPDEFDRGSDDGGPRAKPFVTDTGRAGMGMKF